VLFRAFYNDFLRRVFWHNRRGTQKKQTILGAVCKPTQVG